MSYYWVAASIGVLGSLLGSPVFPAPLRIVGGVLNIVFVVFLVYVAFAVSLGTAALCFLAGVGGAMLGVGLERLALRPLLGAR